MHLSTHYYIISLSERSNALFEAFRDTIIDIRNGGFPVEPPQAPNSVDSIVREERLREVLRIVDRHFGDSYRQDPLRLVVVGEREMQDIFESVTAHRNAIIGRVEGDYSTTSLHDLGKITWPVVREAVSGLVDEAMRELEIATKARRAVCGLPAVSQLAIAGARGTLLVEDDYHMRGSIQRTPQSLEISREVDVMEEMDDAVDMVIEKVLESGGNVVFAPSGSLRTSKNIVLLLRKPEDAR
ncbi:MAG: hypothetical protein HY770_05400 [Chitinivibrionia bacterium]|nr:hypothetical protein [Chitinivibrionia bacterium]